MSCHDVSIGTFYNVNKSCQVIMGNPPINQGLKSPQYWGTRVIGLSQRGRPQQGFSHVKNQYKQRAGLSIYHTLTHTQLQHIAEEEKDTMERNKEVTSIGRSSYCFGGFTFGVDSISEEVAGFFPLWFPRGKTLCSLSLVFDCCAFCSLS